MIFTRIRRRMIWPLAVAVTLEAIGALMLNYAPRIGVARDPSPSLRFAGDTAALIHAPWLMLSDFLCVKFCPPHFILQTITISGGYLDTVILVLAAAAVFRTWRSWTSPL